MYKKYLPIFRNENAYATCLVQAAMDMYGLPPVTALENPDELEIDWGFLSWDPGVMEAELTKDLGERPPGENLTKLQAAFGILITDAFHYNVHAFAATCQALSRGIPMTDEFIPSGLEDTAWGVLEANFLEGPSFWETGFSTDIAAYTGLLLDNHGIYEPPEVFKFATGREELRKKMLSNLEGDPDMYETAVRNQDEAKSELQGYLNRRTAELIHQWMSLPIPYLNRDGEVKRMLSIVEGQTE